MTDQRTPDARMRPFFVVEGEIQDLFFCAYGYNPYFCGVKPMRMPVTTEAMTREIAGLYPCHNE